MRWHNGYSKTPVVSLTVISSLTVWPASWHCAVLTVSLSSRSSSSSFIIVVGSGMSTQGERDCRVDAELHRFEYAS